MGKKEAQLDLIEEKMNFQQVKCWLTARGHSEEGEGGAQSPCVALFIQAFCSCITNLTTQGLR